MLSQPVSYNVDLTVDLEVCLCLPFQSELFIELVMHCLLFGFQSCNLVLCRL